MVGDSHSTHDQYLISRFLGEFRVLKNYFQPGVKKEEKTEKGLDKNIAVYKNTLIFIA